MRNDGVNSRIDGSEGICPVAGLLLCHSSWAEKRRKIDTFMKEGPASSPSSIALFHLQLSEENQTWAIMVVSSSLVNGFNQRIWTLWYRLDIHTWTSCYLSCLIDIEVVCVWARSTSGCFRFMLYFDQPAWVICFHVWLTYALCVETVCKRATHQEIGTMCGRSNVRESMWDLTNGGAEAYDVC